MKDLFTARMAFGHDILGPIFYDFCRKLHLYQCPYRGKAVCLFAYRGGVRLQYLYNKYLTGKSISQPVPQHSFLTSRILALKGAIRNSYDKAEKLLLREYQGYTLLNFFSCFCAGNRIDFPHDLVHTKIDADLLKEAVFGNSRWAKEIQEYLDKQSSVQKEYLAALTGEHREVLLVDTGWSGTTQYFLMKAFPELRWHGHYFGKWDTWRENPPHFHTISGISVEDSMYSCERPETAIFHYHHIIEGLLEPKFPSVEHLTYDFAGEIASSHQIDLTLIPPQADESIFQGICLYFEQATKYTISDISTQTYEAFQKLKKKILYPSPKDIPIMTLHARSADFGKKKLVPILHSTGNAKGLSLATRLDAVKKSIWKQGKIVEEFPLAYPVLLRIFNNRRLNNFTLHLITNYYAHRRAQRSIKVFVCHTG
ncbi:MAG: hypothetical protein U9N19_10235 [Thermodesulfobacteriota bacterium]|nr:hypothetical protein [Thermodesulfobacteriota bacterium]